MIAGDGPERKSLEKKAASYGLQNNVFFLGFVNKPYDFLNSIDINTLTSLSESFPYAILEGSLLKKATISSNVGGISDLIESGINGFLFEPGDYETLAGHILTLINDPALRKKMGEKIHEKASSHFSLDNMCKTQLDIYETILLRSFRNSRSKYRYDAIISGYYGFKNIGDDAMLMAIIDNLRMYRRDLRILVLSRNPLETGLVYNVDSINRFNLLKILLIMRNSKLFINGGGSLIQDNTSTRSLIYYLGMIWLAKKMGMKVMIYANGIGPLNKEKNRKLTKKIVNRVDVITLREKLSYEELNNLKIQSPRIKVTADPAFTIIPEKIERVNQLLIDEGIDPNEQLVGISVRKWGEHEKYETTIAELADYIVEKYGMKPLFIAMHYPEDLAIIQNITSKMKNKSFVITNKPTVSEMLGIIGKTQMLIGMRLHALIFAASLGIPVVGMVYEPKVEGFMQYINQASAGHVNSLELEHMKKIVDETWENREAIKKELEKNTAVLKDKALENAKIAIEMIDEKPL